MQTLYNDAMDYSQFEDWLSEKFASLDEKSARFAKCHRWNMFLPQNYQRIRADMDEQGIPPDVVDIGCGAGFGSAFFLDGVYVGVDRRHPHIGFGTLAKQLSSQFYNEGQANVSYLIDTFPSDAISEVLKKKTMIASMSLGVYSEASGNDWKKIFDAYCNGMKTASGIYLCVPVEFAKYVKDFFGEYREIGGCNDGGDENLPIIYVEP